MKKFLAAGLAAAAFCGAPALAADMPVKAPAAPPMFNWTGFYVGVNAGGAWGRESESLVLTGLFVGLPETPALNNAGSQGTHGSGFIGGAQAGYNIQTGPAVFGIEADINSLRLHGHRFIPNVPNPSANTYAFAATSDTDWMATVRGRAGFASDRLLVYVTGGVAFVDDKFSQTITQLNAPFSETGSASATKSAGIFGGGLEYALGSGWSMKGEYLHANLGRLSFSSAGFCPGVPICAAFTGNHADKLSIDIARAAINYKY